MFERNFLGGFALVTVCSAVSIVAACGGPADGGAEKAVSGATAADEALATETLGMLGAPGLPRPPSNPNGTCGFSGCHSINPVTLKAWQAEFKGAMEVLEGDRPNKEKIDALRRDPLDDRTGFTPERLGILAAGVHLATDPTVTAATHPQTFRVLQKLAGIFQGQAALYAELRRDVKMPVSPEFPTLAAAQFEKLLTYYQKGLPNVVDCGTGIDQLRCLLLEDRPTRCVDDFTKIAARTSAVKTQTWAARNAAQRMPMFGCAAPNPDQPASATTCFRQKREGRDVFPSAANETYARTWAQDGSTVRILRSLTSPNSFWVRTSADGRFVATGGGSNGGAQAIDLQATLEGRSRDIGLQASYDPDFWPDNKAFMFQGGTKFCAQSLLAKASTTLVRFTEPECSTLNGAPGLYQTVGQVVADNSLSDRFLVFSSWAGDAGSYTASSRDTAPRGGKDSSVSIHTAIASGDDVESGYEIDGPAAKIPTPYRGDTMMGRSGMLLGSRWAYGQATDGSTPWGYAIERLDRRQVDGRYQFGLTTIGNVCLKGNKANFSFDERFLATHHYNEPSDFTASDDPAYRQKGSADIFVVDFVSGKKQKVTKMGPGQFALYAHFRSDGWLYFLVVDRNASPAAYRIVASDWAIRQTEATPTP